MMIKDLSDLHIPERFMKKLIKDMDYLLGYEALDIEEVILFGSCARGTCKVTSDIDILVITKESIERYVRGDIASELDEEVEGVRTDVVFYSRQVFETSTSLLVKQINQDGIIIYNNKGIV
ncbi:MAG: nucleotidyltransferase domain-containing protein [Cellulosilyticaceae bacterium]